MFLKLFDYFISQQKNKSDQLKMFPLNLIVAACEGGGIGKGGTLPWRLPSEMRFGKINRYFEL